MASELVSVIIPVFNQEQFIRASVQCALGQTYQPVEVIVINDGSTDTTAQQLEPFLPRITYFFQPNAGLSAARNAGIRLAKGEWIALLDADDLWHPQKLEIQLKAVQNRNKVALVGSPAAKALPDTLPSDPNVKYLTVRDFLVSARMGPSSALLRRRCLESVGFFDESLQSVEDRDMWLRIAALFPCVLVESPCWWYRTHTGQMSRQAERMFRNYLRVLNKFFQANPDYRRLQGLAMSYLYFDAAMAYFDEGERMTALRCLAQSARYRPLGLGDSKRSPLARLRLARRIVLDEIHQAATNS